jgi:hypothetical protein
VELGAEIVNSSELNDIPLASTAGLPNLATRAIRRWGRTKRCGASSYTADTILYMKTLKTLDYLSPIIIGDDAGFSDPAFILAVGDIGQGVIGTSASQAATPLGSTRCSRQRPAGILTTPARVGSRAFWSSPTPSTACKDPAGAAADRLEDEPAGARL